MSTIDQKRIIEIPNTYEHIIRKMNELALEQFGLKNFIDTRDKGVLRILVWLMKDEKYMEKAGMDPRKGILLAGESLQKNRIMDLVRRLTFEPEYKMHFEMQNCSTVSNTFSKEGPAVIERYSAGSVDKNASPRAICFCDLGKEMKSQYYGNSCYVMEQVLYERHELLYSRGTMTHLTTSLTSDEVEACYGR